MSNRSIFHTANSPHYNIWKHKKQLLSFVNVWSTYLNVLCRNIFLNLCFLISQTTFVEFSPQKLQRLSAVFQFLQVSFSYPGWPFWKFCRIVVFTIFMPPMHWVVKIERFSGIRQRDLEEMVQFNVILKTMRFWKNTFLQSVGPDTFLISIGENFFYLTQGVYESGEFCLMILSHKPLLGSKHVFEACFCDERTLLIG